MMSSGYRRDSDLNDTGKHSRRWWNQVPGPVWAVVLVMFGYAGSATVDKFVVTQFETHNVVTIDPKDPLSDVIRKRDLDDAVKSINQSISDRFKEIKIDIGVIAGKSARDRAHSG